MHHVGPVGLRQISQEAQLGEVSAAVSRVANAEGLANSQLRRIGAGARVKRSVVGTANVDVMARGLRV